jgi:hypothetical protein
MTDRQESRTYNTGLAKEAVQCSTGTFVVNQSLFLRINICGENRHLRQARNRNAVGNFKRIAINKNGGQNLTKNSISTPLNFE